MLIVPPVVKPCEPPAGMARLAACLQAHHIPTLSIDASLEGLMYFVDQPPAFELPTDPWTRRAAKHAPGHLENLRLPALYKDIARYKQAIADIQRLLRQKSAPYRSILSLGDFHHRDRSPQSSQDLVRSFETPAQSLFYPYFTHRLAHQIESFQPTWIGLSINFISQAICAFHLLGFVAQRWPWVKRVIGGSLITSWMRQANRLPDFSGMADAAIAGPGETPLLNLLNQPAASAAYAPDYLDATRLPYLAPGFILPFSAAEGCYWRRCRFCPERAEQGPYIPIGSQTIHQYLTREIARTQPALIHFLDNAMRPSLLHVLAGHRLPAPWYGFARVSRQLADPDFCQALRRAGCVMLKLGIESGDQSVLDAMEKGATVDMAARALKSLADAGIATFVYLLFGTPAETEKQALKTLDFTVANHSYIDFINMAVFNMPIQSPDGNRLRTISYGKERPIEICSTEACYTKNRRAVTVLAGGLTS